MGVGMGSSFALLENPDWHGAISGLGVTACVARHSDRLEVVFDVVEPQDCYRCQCVKDSEPCWQDSCVEVFVASPRHGGYYNFEVNSAGVSLAEFGQAREARRLFLPEEYARVMRKVEVSPHSVGAVQIAWKLSISIPLDLIGLEPCEEIRGNLYKCASGAVRPHYLMAFPVSAAKPDFHRPECFGVLAIGRSEQLPFFGQ